MLLLLLEWRWWWWDPSTVNFEGNYSENTKDLWLHSCTPPPPPHRLGCKLKYRSHFQYIFGCSAISIIYSLGACSLLPSLDPLPLPLLSATIWAATMGILIEYLVTILVNFSIHVQALFYVLLYPPRALHTNKTAPQVFPSSQKVSCVGISWGRSQF